MSGRGSIIRSFPFKAVVYLSLLNLLTFLPFAIYPGREPWFLSSDNPMQIGKWGISVLASAGASMILIFLYLLFRAALGRRAAQIVGGTLLVVFFSLLNVASFYYMQFGGYPPIDLMVETVRSPDLLIGYAVYGTESGKLLSLAGICLMIIFFTILTVRSRNLTSPTIHTFVISFLCSAGFLFCMQRASSLKAEFKAYGTFANLSLPLFKVINYSLGYSAENSMELVEKYLPASSGERRLTLPPESRPKHVLLIIMESLRADHLPFYGYERNTMPKNSATRSDWIAYLRHYTHGPWTAASFSTIFSSRYLAASTESNKGAELSGRFWRVLSRSGVKTAFISSGDLEWGSVDSRSRASEAEVFIESGDAGHHERELYSVKDTADKSLSDRFAVSRYTDFLKRSNGATFATLFLMGCHFPYRVIDDNEPFQPTLVPGEAYPSPEEKRTRHINAYDNSILGFDTVLDEIFTLLRERGVLEESVVLVTSDHGESLGEGNNYYHGFHLSEEQIRVPMIVYSGGKLPGLRDRFIATSGDLHGHVDIAPTILDLFGIDPFEEHQGSSLLQPVKKPYEVVPYAALARKIAVINENVKFIYDLDSQSIIVEGPAADAMRQELSRQLPADGLDTEGFLSLLADMQLIKGTFFLDKEP